MSTTRRRHLMDPANPVRPRNDQSLTAVQRRVSTALVLTTVFHLVVGLIIAAAFISTRDGKVGLLVIAAVFGVLGIAGSRVIHQKSPATPWLLLGVVPSIVGTWWVL